MTSQAPSWLTLSITEIIPGLFISDQNVSWWIPSLQENNVTAIISLAQCKMATWDRASWKALIPPDKHLFVACLDSDTQDMLVYLRDICDFIERQREGPGGVLVHCSAGILRSPMVVCAYLMWKEGKGVDEVLQLVKEKRKVKPSGNLMRQLRVWEEVGYGIWEDEDEGKVPKKEYAAYLLWRAGSVK